MIVIDYSGVAIAAITGFKEDLQRDEEHVANLIRHVVLSTIKNYKKKFRKEYGNELVIAVDSAPYWRKAIFPHYKAKRKKSREESDIPWDLIHKYMRLVLEDIREHFPWKVIAVQSAEADDIMAVLAQDIAVRNGKSDSLLDTEDAPEKTVIISSDKDLKQLMTHPNIRCWSPYQEAYAKLDEPVKMFLRRLILKGDPGDGVPNVFSPDDSFMTGIRQKPATEKKMQPLLEAANMLEATDDETLKQRIIENTRLISFSGIPKSLRQQIIDAYYVEPTGSKMKILKYFAKNDMKRMLDDLDDF